MLQINAGKLSIEKLRRRNLHVSCNRCHFPHNLNARKKEIQKMLNRMTKLVAAAVLAMSANAAIGQIVDSQRYVKSQVDTAVQAITAKYGVPGMSIGIIDGGKFYVFNYGVASKETKQPVRGDTLFEIGSISKTFTATLASYAQVGGHLSLWQIRRASTYHRYAAARSAT